MTFPSIPVGAAFPPASSSTGIRALIAGAAGLAIWEPFARLIAPIWLGHPLDPTALIELSIGLTGAPAFILHLLTGLVAYPLAYLFVVRPLAARVAPDLPWPVLGLGYGVALWIFAMYVMASLVGGMPAFLGFEAVAWASLVGHVGLALGIAGAVAALAGAAR